MKKRIDYIEEELEQLEIEFTKRIASIRRHIKLLKDPDISDTFLWKDTWVEDIGKEIKDIPDEWKEEFKRKLDEVFEKTKEQTGIVKPVVPVVTMYGCPSYEPFTGTPLYNSITSTSFTMGDHDEKK